MRSFKISLSLALAALWTFGCDGYIAARGRVYRLVDPSASARGEIVVDRPDFQLPTNVEPVEGAEVTIYHDPAYAHRDDEEARLWRIKKTSGPDGSFSLGSTGALGAYDIAVGVTREGCQSLLQTFRHGRREHEMTVLLVCAPISSPAPSSRTAPAGRP
jgi:hypothetical protein